MDLKRYLKIEDALTRKFVKAWRPLSVKIFAPVIDALEAEDYAKAYKAAEEIDLEPLTKATVEQAKYMLYGAATFGAQMAAQGQETFFSAGSYEKTFAKIGHQLSLSIEHNTTLHLYRTLVQLIAEQEQGKVQKADKRFVRELVSFQEAGDESLQLISSLHTSRLAVWGFTAEADFRAITEYTLTSVLDGRTSDFCRIINGKRFAVADAKERVNAALNVDDPNDLKTVHPWPKQTKEAINEFAGMSAQALKERGFLIPPFHPNCRTLCTVVGKAKPVAAVTPETQEHKELVKPEAFTAIGTKISRKDLEKWNALVGKAPAEILSSFTGVTPDKLVDKVLGEQSFFSFSADGVLKIKADVDTARTAAVFDPIEGKLYQSYAEFNEASPEEASKWVAGWYGRTAKTTKQLGGTAVVVTAAGVDGAYAHARMGFVPASPGAWLDLQTEIEADLGPDGDLSAVWPQDPVKQKLLVDILDHQDVKGFWALAAFPAEHDGTPLGEVLLRNRTIEVVYLMDDAEAKQRFDGSIK